ncbi:MAG: aminotransferase class IV [Bacteroidales bacterium]
MCQFIETIAMQDGQLLNLPKHIYRFNQTHVSMGWHLKNLGQILSEYSFPESGLYKVRVIYSESGADVEFALYSSPVLRKIGIVRLTDFDYSLKSADRSCFRRLYEDYPGFDDYLIVRGGLFTDSTFCNIAFLKDGDWITPEKPLLEGTKRALLLERKEIKKGNIALSDLNEYSHISFFNAMNDHKTIIIPVADCFCLGEIDPVSE